MKDDKRFEVWALGYDKNDCCTDVEVLMVSFLNKDQAIKFADCFETIEDITVNYESQLAIFDDLQKGDYFEIRVETVRDVTPNHSENIETVFSKTIKATDDEKPEYNAAHAQEWMEKHPHGWYNNEDDYGAEED